MQSLQNWTASSASIGRKETAYLTIGYDLVNLTSQEDGVVERIGWLLEDILSWVDRTLRRVGLSSNLDVSILPKNRH